MNRNVLHLHLPPFVIPLFLSLTPSPFFYLLSIFSLFLFPSFLSSFFLPLLHLLLFSRHENEYPGLSSRDFLSFYHSLDQCQVPSLILSCSLFFSHLSLPSFFFPIPPSYETHTSHSYFPYPLKDSLQRHLKNGLMKSNLSMRKMNWKRQEERERERKNSLT